MKLNKVMSLVMSSILSMSMLVGCNKKSELDKAYDYVVSKYEINNASIEKIEETNFIAVEIFTDKTEKTDKMVKNAEELQEQIQIDVLRQGYDVAITVSYVNENLEVRHIYIAMADISYYEKLLNKEDE